MGGGGTRQRHAYPASADERYLPPRACVRSAGCDRRPFSQCLPRLLPSFDYLHVGELGDATNDLIARLARDPSRRSGQVVLKTADRLDMTQFPLPAYELAELRKYFSAASSIRAGARINANSAISRDFMAAIRA